MKDVYLYLESNKISFNYERNKSVCIGETDGSFQDF